MKILILYATHSGSTQQASQVLADNLESNNMKAVLKQVNQTDPHEIINYDSIVLASPSWDYDGKEGMPHEDYISFMDKAKDFVWKEKSFAVLGLGDSSYTHFCGAVNHLEKFIREKEGKLIIDSLKIDGYYFDQDTYDNNIKNWSEKLTSKLNATQ